MRSTAAFLPDWLQTVPETWDTPLLRLVARVESGHTPSRSHPEYWVPEECTIPWFSLADIWQLRDGKQKYLGDTKERVSPAGLANSSARLLPADTVVLSRTASVGFSGIMPRPMATTQDFANFVCGGRLDPEFLLWALRGMRPEFDRIRMGSTHQTIYMPDIAQFRIPLPSKAVQSRIADFLDRKTAAIDALTEKKERLIELLAEKRAALIHRAVTKGLNPDVPMKDSGVPWIGEIPAHWKLVAIRWLASVFNGSTPSRAEPRYWSGPNPWVSSGKVNDWKIEEPSAVISDSAVADSGLRLAPKGSVVIGMVGQGKTRGKSARLAMSTFINQNMAAIVPGNSLDSSYLHYALVQAYNPIREYGRGGQQDALNCELVADIRIPLPPIGEQEEICAHLDRQLEVSDSIASKLTEQIERSLEYRQALITAAVTGQLDIEAEES